MKIFFIVSLLVGLSSNLMAADYYNAKFATTGGSYSSATQVPTSRAVCHRATGNLSSCTNKMSCGGGTLWPTSSQMKKFQNWIGKSKSNIIWITDGSDTVCKMR